jgi:hypothetical protein
MISVTSCMMSKEYIWIFIVFLSVFRKVLMSLDAGFYNCEIFVIKLLTAGGFLVMALLSILKIIHWTQSLLKA